MDECRLCFTKRVCVLTHKPSVIFELLGNYLMNTATYKKILLECQWKALNYFSFQQHSTFSFPTEIRCKPLNTRATAIYPQPDSSAHSISTELLSRPVGTRKNKASSPASTAIVQTFQTQPAPRATPLTRATPCPNFQPRKSIGGTASPAICCTAGPGKKSSTGSTTRRKPSAFAKTCASD